jgi:hypothetical protein
MIGVRRALPHERQVVAIVVVSFMVDVSQVA